MSTSFQPSGVGAACDGELDVIVLGAGPVGQNVAARTRSAGLSVAVVERELVGGECSYWGCVPSKSLLRPVLAVADARRIDGAREAVTGAIAAAGVFRRRDRYVTNWDDSGQAEFVEGLDAALYRGHARLAGPRRVSVATADGKLVELTARHAVAICTGSTATLPDIPGIAEARPWTNRKATDSSIVPPRLVVVGAGGVGVEMATAWRGLGSKVTLLTRTPRLLPRMEPFVGEHVVRGLTEAGVEVRTGVSVAELRRPGGTGLVWIGLDNGDQIEADEILFAIGRTPNTGDIGLETIGLTPGSWLDVDDTCLVRNVDAGWLYAMGDANHRALLTHQGKYQARMASNAIAARAHGAPVDMTPWSAHVATADSQATPQVFFTDPEAASVGLTAEQAERAGHRIKIVDVNIGETVPGANFYADGYAGHARMVVDLDREHLLGVSFVGPGVAELLHSATVAVAGRVPVDRLWHAVPCFPTISEVWLKLMEAHRDTPDVPTSLDESLVGSQ
ncbi:pyridine nucleotide-disulfide oxidoreductase [Mycobacterium sp. ACS1612]|uniref:dihydrolipoyl dehydrogenase family protein n=1 Tax=Mycobacterium sp. ACS1612 TaxID=1834117 RepID=UPI0007FE80AE|nr:NAD(P)/FAD-dependent oxidoreductase [Mycobacterium sp. ACS1612]OBF26065.1 pyridine nucleotide-disulfide oxidoreductase [Mycobacterium sp. ACS1612]